MSSVNYAAVALLITATLAAGIIHGTMSNRWPSANLKAAEERLRQPFPEKLGNWQMKREMPLDAEAAQMLQCSAFVNRVYENVETGDTVSVALLLGPTGPISVHTPEVCYQGRDYSQSKQRKSASIEDLNGNVHSLWEVGLDPKRAETAPLRVFYGWTTGSTWAAPARPRFNYGGAPYLYKLQLSGSPFQGGPDDFDPCRDFLSNFLTQVQPRMVDAAPAAKNLN